MENLKLRIMRWFGNHRLEEQLLELDLNTWLVQQRTVQIEKLLKDGNVCLNLQHDEALPDDRD